MEGLHQTIFPGALQALVSSSPKLIELIEPQWVLELNVDNKAQALRVMSDALAGDPRILEPETFHQAILRREEQVSTGVGMGIAIPHVKIPQVSDYVMAIGRIRQGIDFDALDGQPVHLIFLIGASDRQTKEFVRILARVTYLLRSEKVRQTLMEAEIPGAFLDVIRQNER